MFSHLPQFVILFLKGPIQLLVKEKKKVVIIRRGCPKEIPLKPPHSCFSLTEKVDGNRLCHLLLSQVPQSVDVPSFLSLKGNCSI